MKVQDQHYRPPKTAVVSTTKTGTEANFLAADSCRVLVAHHVEILALCKEHQLRISCEACACWVGHLMVSLPRIAGGNDIASTYNASLEDATSHDTLQKLSRDGLPLLSL